MTRTLWISFFLAIISSYGYAQVPPKVLPEIYLTSIDAPRLYDEHPTLQEAVESFEVVDHFVDVTDEILLGEWLNMYAIKKEIVAEYHIPITALIEKTDQKYTLTTTHPRIQGVLSVNEKTIKATYDTYKKFVYDCKILIEDQNLMLCKNLDLDNVYFEIFIRKTKSSL